MKEKISYIVWGALYILCAGLGFIENANGFGKVLLVVLAIVFFVPGAMLLYEGIRQKDRKKVLRIRYISAIVLGLTLVTLIANFFSVLASEAVGEALYDLLVLVSAPMVCGQFWIIGLFLWACLLMASFHKAVRKK